MISFQPLYDLMKKRNLSFYDLEVLGIEHATAYRLKHGQNIRLRTLDKLCKELECGVTDIICFIPDKK
ncbi:MAG: helix-turn-helix domain-containing protein [Oscillospiraceae bacterium]